MTKRRHFKVTSLTIRLLLQNRQSDSLHNVVKYANGHFFKIIKRQGMYEYADITLRSCYVNL